MSPHHLVNKSRVLYKAANGPPFEEGMKPLLITSIKNNRVRRAIAALRIKTFHFRDKLVSRFPSLLPPIGVGHDEDGNVLGRSDLPKQGEVINLYRKGTILFADFGRVPRKVIELVKGGVYDKVSCELWPKPPGLFRGAGWMLKRIALLGADVPGVYTLEEIPKPDEGIGMIRGVEVFETGLHNDIEYDLDDLDDIVRNYWLNRPGEQKIKAMLSRYLGRDAVKPLSDGAATMKHKDTQPVFIFRDLKQTYTVNESQGSYTMSPDDIRAALVAQGLFEEDEVKGMPDSAIMKLASMCGIQNNEDTNATAEGEQKKPVANASGDTSAETEEEKPKAPVASNADTTPAKPTMYSSAHVGSVVAMQVKQQLDRALSPFIAKFNDMTKTVIKSNKTTEALANSAMRTEAKNFCDRLRSEKKLTHGMNADGLVSDFYLELANVPGEFHFNDSAGKKQKGSLAAKFQQIMDRLPPLENWDELAGGPLGDDAAAAGKTSDELKLEKGYAAFSDSFKSGTSLEQYKKSFADAKKMYGSKYSVEEYLS